jgi:hypothetical protein
MMTCAEWYEFYTNQQTFAHLPMAVRWSLAVETGIELEQRQAKASSVPVVSGGETCPNDDIRVGGLL